MRQLRLSRQHGGQSRTVLRMTAALASLVLGGCNWLQFGGSSGHSGNNASERAILATNAPTLRQVFQTSLPGNADGAPPFVESISTPAGPRNLLFVTTTAGDLVAVDAGSGAIVWQAHHPAGTCKTNNGSQTCYTTSSPAVDPTLKFVYTYGLDGAVHKHNIATGAEVLGSKWPVMTTLKGFDEKGSAALSIATSKAGITYLYVSHGGYPGDNGDYQGHITTIQLADGATGDGTSTVFNMLCSDQAVHFVKAGQSGPDCPQTRAGVWSRAGVTYDAGTDLVYVSTGNGVYAPGAHRWGDSVVALHPDGTGVGGGNPVDAYTPANFQALSDSDTDLGSTLPAILPSSTNSAYRHLGVQGGKDAKLRFVNLADLSGQGGPGHTGGEIGAPVDVPQGNEVFSDPVVWTDAANSTWIFVTTASGVSGIQIGTGTGGAPTFVNRWQVATPGTASTATIAGGVLYVATSGTVYALNPVTGAQLWSGSVGGIHWQSPVVVDGRLYVTDGSSHLMAFAPA